MNSKQRAMLRGMANTMETILYIGKDGVVPGTIKQASDALEARELIKCAVQQGCPLTAREAVCRAGSRTGAVHRPPLRDVPSEQGQSPYCAGRLMVTHPFAPVVDENCRTLILGSFPSVKSRENGFYYGHPQNRFWRMLVAVRRMRPCVRRCRWTLRGLPTGRTSRASCATASWRERSTRGTCSR